MTAPLHVLLVEDNQDDARLVETRLERTDPGAATVHRAETLAAALARVSDQPVDVVLLDLSLPDSEGLSGFTRLHDLAPEVPIVVLSGHPDRSTALQAVKQGAQDYLLKDHVDGETLLRALRYAVERKRGALALKAATDELRDLYEHAPCGYHTVDKNGVIVRMNHTELKWLGYRREEVEGLLRAADLLAPGSWRFVRELQNVLLHQGYLSDLDVELSRKDGTALPVLLSLVPLSNAQGTYLWTRCTVVNVSWQRGAVVERDQLLRELDDARRHAARLMSLLPICPSCHRIQDEQGTWVPLDRVLEEHDVLGPYTAQCPECSGRGEAPAPPAR